MNGQELAGAERRRSRRFRQGLAALAAGALATAIGFAFGLARSGDAATGWGVLAGVGFGVMLMGGAAAWLNRPGGRGWMAEAQGGKRERLQSRRAQQLFLFPLVALVFLGLAVQPVGRVVAGEGGLRDLLWVLLPVLYAWVTAAVAMGWDHHSRQNRRWLEDELTVVLRARAMTAAFFVLMSGATVALALMLVRPGVGAVALLAALAAGGVTAGARFAWLDREAGRDG